MLLRFTHLCQGNVLFFYLRGIPIQQEYSCNFRTNRISGNNRVTDRPGTKVCTFEDTFFKLCDACWSMFPTRKGDGITNATCGNARKSIDVLGACFSFSCSASHAPPGTAPDQALVRPGREIGLRLPGRSCGVL